MVIQETFAIRLAGTPGSGSLAAMEIIASSRRLTRRLARLRFGPPVERVYNPLTYARETWESYLTRYARPGVEDRKSVV